MKQLLNFYINSSIHVALSASALALVTLLEFGLPCNTVTVVFIFFATVTGYNFVKYCGIAKWHFRSLTTNLKVIQAFSAVCFLVLLYFAWQLHKKVLLLCAVFGVITFLYAMPLFSKHSNIDNLRQVSGLKIYIIALVWSGVTVVLPLINDNYNLDYDVTLTVLQRFIYVIVLMIPFEIRDLKFDNLKLGTLPQKIGVKHTKQLGVFLLIVFFFLEFFKDAIEGTQVIPLFLITVITGVFVVFSKVNQSKYYASFWVESLPLVWLIFLLSLNGN